MERYKQLMAKNIMVKFMKEDDPMVFWEGSFSSDSLSGKYKLETHESLHENDKLLIRFYFNDSFNYSEAKVKVLESKKEAQETSFQTGIEFLHISNSLLNKIT